MKKLLALTTAFLLLPGLTKAQTDSLKNDFRIGLNFLAHGEICGGGLPRDINSTENHSAFILGRTRLALDYQRDNWFQVHLMLQNNAVWGMQGNQTLGLYEGWVKATAPSGLFAQIGRIALSYDDERIIGPNDFAAASRSHDVLRVGYEGHGHKLHLILAYNQNGDKVYSGTYYAGGNQPYKTMQTLWYHYDVPVFPLGASLLFMNMGLQAGTEGKKDNPPRTEYQQMFGGYLNFHPRYVSVEASYYRQIGKHVDESMHSMPIKAWMASVKANLKPSERYGFLAGYDHLSGDDYVPTTYGGPMGMPRHEYLGGFTPLYGSRTKFYGLLDFYYESAFIHGFTPGLQNAYAGVFGNPLKALSCGATYHYLAVATPLQGLGLTLGHSVDLELSYEFTKDISLVVGYTYMMGTETMAILKKEGGSKHAQWGWFSLVINPTLFSKKW